MNTEDLFDQNQWWKDKNLINQDYDITKWNENKYKWIPNIIKGIELKPFSFHIITGPRQAGKTTAIKLLIKELLNTLEPKSIFYFNCENVSDYKELTEILKMYIEFKEANKIKNSIILLDEITTPKEWYRAIKYLIDIGKFINDVLIITGSSTISVKRNVELFPGRRGHGKDLILYPLSFRGFLKIFAPEITDKIPTIESIEDIDKLVLNALMFKKELNEHLKKYMEYGGFPLSVINIDKNKEDAKRTYLNWIKNAILKAERSDIIAKEIASAIIETLQTDISWENTAKKIEIKSPKTVAAYVELFKSIFVANILYNIDPNNKKIRFGKNKKIHLRDSLLLEIFEDWCLTKSKNKESALAESLVVEHLIRKFPERIFFWKDKFEIDVILLEKSKIYGFEVKWSDKTETKVLKQLKRYITITKTEYSKDPLKIPLAVFLSLFDV